MTYLIGLYCPVRYICILYIHRGLRIYLALWQLSKILEQMHYDITALRKRRPIIGRLNIKNNCQYAPQNLPGVYFFTIFTVWSVFVRVFSVDESVCVVGSEKFALVHVAVRENELISSLSVLLKGWSVFTHCTMENVAVILKLEH